MRNYVKCNYFNILYNYLKRKVSVEVVSKMKENKYSHIGESSSAKNDFHQDAKPHEYSKRIEFNEFVKTTTESHPILLGKI